MEKKKSQEMLDLEEDIKKIKEYYDTEEGQKVLEVGVKKAEELGEALKPKRVPRKILERPFDI